MIGALRKGFEPPFLRWWSYTDLNRNFKRAMLACSQLHYNPTSVSVLTTCRAANHFGDDALASVHKGAVLAHTAENVSLPANGALSEIRTHHNVFRRDAFIL